MKSIKTIIFISLITFASSLMAMDQAEEQWARNYIAIEKQKVKKLEEELQPRKALVMQKLAAMSPQSLQALTDDDIAKIMEYSAQHPDQPKHRQELWTLTRLVSSDPATTRPMHNRINPFISKYLFAHIPNDALTDDEIRFEKWADAQSPQWDTQEEDI